VPNPDQIKEIILALQQYSKDFDQKCSDYKLNFFHILIEGNIKNQEAQRCIGQIESAF